MSRKDKLKLKKTFFGILLVSMMVASFVITTVYTNIQRDSPESITDFLSNPKRWIQLPSTMAANNSPGAGTFGIINVMTVEHGQLSYSSGIDLSSSHVFEQFDGTPAVDEELDKTTPHGVTYDYVVVVQFTGAQAYNDSSSSWDTGLVKAYINITTSYGSHTVSSQLMSEGGFYDSTGTSDSDTAKMNFYVDNTGSGYTLGIDESFTCPIASNGCKIYYYG